MALEHFIGDPNLTISGQFQGQFNHGRLDLRIHAVFEQRAAVGDFLQRRFAAFIVQFLESVEALA